MNTFFAIIGLCCVIKFIYDAAMAIVYRARLQAVRDYVAKDFPL